MHDHLVVSFIIFPLDCQFNLAMALLLFYCALVGFVSSERDMFGFSFWGCGKQEGEEASKRLKDTGDGPNERNAKDTTAIFEN